MTFTALTPESAISPVKGARVRNKLAAISAIALGAVFIFIIGFSHINAVHNAAHDTRHSAAFPCH